MQHFLLVFYILFFATGFMGGAALYMLGLRVRSKLISPLLTFQLLFLLGLGIIVVYYYLEALPGGINPSIKLPLALLMTIINASLYAVAILLIHRISPQAGRKKGYPMVAKILSALVIVKSLVNMGIQIAASLGASTAVALGGSIVYGAAVNPVGLAMAAFGAVACGQIAPGEPPVMKPLLKAYGLCALVFAPMGLVEFAVNAAGLPWLPSISLDHFFYLAWNIVSMTAAIKLFTPGDGGVPILDSVPAERKHSLGLSGREAEMAVMIARGLANKEITSCPWRIPDDTTPEDHTVYDSPSHDCGDH